MASRRKTGAVAAATAAVLAAASLFGLQSGGTQLYETKRTLWPAYQAVPRTWDRWGPKTDLSYRIDVMAERLDKHRGEGYQLRQAGNDEWSVTRSLVNTMDVLQDRMTHSKVGITWYVKAKVDQYQEKIRKLDLNPAMVKNTEGTEAIDIIVGTLIHNFPQLKIGGIYVCKSTVNGGISQHAHANAVDVFASFAYMDNVAKTMLDFTRKDFVPVSQILWNYKNLLSGNYVYDHTNHIHFSGDPLIMRTGCGLP